MIELRGVTKQFQTKQNTVTALDKISLIIEKGDIFGIIGYSGAGKSTLLRMVNGLEKPNEGDVIVAGKRIKDLTENELNQLRKKIGMVFQQFSLLETRTVFQNIALPLVLLGKNKSDIAQRVEELLDFVDLKDKKDVPVNKLSGGQKQRVGIARALATNPEILLCDEATSALDPKTTQSILKLLKKINQNFGITILLITHEMEVVKQICDQVAVIDQGRLVEQGTVGEIFANPKTELAQEFIRSTFHISLPDEYLENLTDTPKHSKAYPIIKFEFTGRSVDAPLLSQASKKFGVELSILTSQIDYAGGVKFGYTIAEVEGDEDAITQTKVYLMENNVRVEVLGYVQ